MAEKQSKSGTKKASAKTKKSTKNGFLEILGDSRTRTIAGLFLVIVSAFLTLAFVSYLIDGPADQSAVQELSETIANPDERVNNWMGKFGAGVAEQFIYNWFGFAAFLFPFLLLIIGLKVLFRKSIVPISRAIQHSLFFLYLLPLTMGFLFSENFSLSGGLGYQLHRWTSSLVGSTGTALIILFLSVIYLSVVFNLSVDGIKELFSAK
ncbi:MAG: DNA translocase FtsK 4TM domain-containing protein, partial [Flavobacteriales bacterium]